MAGVPVCQPPHEAAPRSVPLCHHSVARHRTREGGGGLPSHGAAAAAGPADDEEWVDSDWVVIGDRRYKVTVVPTLTPDWVVFWGDTDSIVMGILGLVRMRRAANKRRTLTARVYWQQNRWFNGPIHRVVSEEFPTEHAVNLRAKQFVESLRAGTVPASTE